MTLGRHVLFDGVVSKAAWRQVEVHPGIGFLLERAALAGGATVLASHLIILPCPGRSRSDSPSGGTAWVGLDESHVTLHWYDDSELVKFALDVFTCGVRADSYEIVDQIVSALPGCVGEILELARFKPTTARKVGSVLTENES